MDGTWLLLTRPNWARKVCQMILFIGGPVDGEWGPVDWRALKTWKGDIALDTVGEVA